MSARLLFGLVLLGAMTVLVGSCEHEERESRELTETGYAAWVPPEQVPAMLVTIGERSEDVIAAAATDDWPRVLACVRDISDAWADYQHPTVEPLTFPRPPATLLYGELSAALARLQDAAAARQALATMRAANDVDAAAADLHEYYHPAVPPDLYRLRALERRIVLDAAESRLATMAGTLDEAYRAWARVRTAVAANSTPNVAATFTDLLDAQQTALDAGNPEAVGHYARQAIDLLRGMVRLTY